jgi:hypothetical protein
MTRAVPGRALLDGVRGLLVDVAGTLLVGGCLDVTMFGGGG